VTARAGLPETLAAALAGRYAIEREVGRGGMATVYLARDLRHDRRVALKVLHPDLAAALGAERFLAEIRTTANLQHPHILPLHDSGEAEGHLFYVMPFVEGETLRAQLARETQLPVGDAVRIAREVLGALDYAHRQGVVHRDVKPENVLLHDGSALVADFGIALAVTAAGGQRMTQTGLSLGTPQYMAPEQALGERAIDGRADVYAAGAVLYELLTGEPPFTGATVQAIVAKVMTERPTAPTTVRDTIPPPVEAAVLKALCKLPADRFATAKEFADALAVSSGPWAASHGGATRAGLPSLTARSRQRMATRALRALPWLIAAFFLVTTVWGWLRVARQVPRRVLRYTLALDSGQVLGGGQHRAALSPDGATIVYGVGSAQQGGLYRRRRDELHATKLPGTEGAISPFFSPDGDRVAFFVRDRLNVSPLEGGPPVTLLDSAVRTGGSWGRDGTMYLVVGTLPRIARLTPAHGERPRPLTIVDTATGEIAHRFPEVLPGGRGVLFTIYYGGKGTTGTAVAVADVSTGRYRVLVAGRSPRYAPPGYLLYATDDHRLLTAPFDERSMRITGEPAVVAEGLVFSSGFGASADYTVSRSGTLAYVAQGALSRADLVWVSREGRAEPVDTAWRALFRFPSLSPDGRRLAVTAGEPGASSIWVRELDRGPRVRLGQTLGGSLGHPSWTPDGRSLTFMAGTAQDLYTQRADGGAPPTLTLHQSRALNQARWSPDGTWLAFRTGSGTEGRGDVLAIRPGVDSAPTPIATTGVGEAAPAFSPDGRWLAYASSETGRQEIVVVSFPDPGRVRVTVSTNGGGEPRWSRSGTELFYRDGRNDMVVATVRTAPTFAVTRTSTLFPSRDYQTDGQGAAYDVTPDAKRFLMIRKLGPDAPDQVVVVDNWIEALRATAQRRRE
jgi:serine/threonine-protein kinase